MKKLFIVANWKSNKIYPDTLLWIDGFKSAQIDWEKNSDKEIVICPSFPNLGSVQYDLQTKYKLPVKIGAQNLSPFGNGAYTGEVYAEQIQYYADYVIIGHSERRQHFGETDEILAQKVRLAITGDLKPIFCVQGKETPVPQGVEIVAYEPIFAIGTGQPDTPEDAEEVSKFIKEKNPQVKYVLYGGSVNKDDVHTFTEMPSVDGVLVGGASLDAEHFMKIIENA
jgi:triosephosphate isomerase